MRLPLAFDFLALYLPLYFALNCVKRSNHPPSNNASPLAFDFPALNLPSHGWVDGLYIALISNQPPFQTLKARVLAFDFPAPNLPSYKSGTRVDRRRARLVEAPPGQSRPHLTEQRTERSALARPVVTKLFEGKHIGSEDSNNHDHFSRCSVPKCYGTYGILG